MSSGPEPLRPEAFRDLLQKKLSDFRLELDDLKEARLARFLAELDRWRRTVNLTGRLSPDGLVLHALESAFGANLLPLRDSVVDIGTGGGFPGVPLAVCRPDLRWIWLEPREKRAAFLRHVARTVPVENAEVVTGRSDELAGEDFDSATSIWLELVVTMIARLLRSVGGLFLWSPRENATKFAFLSLVLRLEQT